MRRRVFTRAALELVADIATKAYRRGVCTANPVPGQLVIEPDVMWRGFTAGRTPPDLDAIGWLVAHGPAPIGLIGTRMREVWDVWALSGNIGHGVDGTLRFENAEFFALPADIAELVG